VQSIFIHGSGGCMESWQFQTSYFQGSEALNLPGHPDGDLRPSIDAYVEWLHQYIGKKGFKDVILIGHSMGGGIALQYALDHAEDLKGIVMISSGARLRVHPMFLETLEKSVANPNEAVNPLGNMFEKVDPELAVILQQRSEENGLVSFFNDLKACDKFDVMERLSSISVPIMAICGDLDLMTPPKYSNFLANAVPGTRVVLIPDGTHMAYAEKPEEVNLAIEEFIRELTVIT
jgi:pimeloyl-ACP methyl ester carboxylesterase